MTYVELGLSRGLDVDVFAPGVDIYSTGSATDSTYFAAQGTSPLLDLKLQYATIRDEALRAATVLLDPARPDGRAVSTTNASDHTITGLRPIASDSGPWKMLIAAKASM